MNKRKQELEGVSLKLRRAGGGDVCR